MLNLLRATNLTGIIARLTSWTHAFQTVYDGFSLLIESKLLLADLSFFLQEHKVSGGPLKSIALFTSARLSVQPVTEGT